MPRIVVLVPKSVASVNHAHILYIRVVYMYLYGATLFSMIAKFSSTFSPVWLDIIGDTSMITIPFRTLISGFYCRLSVFGDTFPLSPLTPSLFLLGMVRARMCPLHHPLIHTGPDTTFHIHSECRSYHRPIRLWY